MTDSQFKAIRALLFLILVSVLVVALELCVLTTETMKIHKYQQRQQQPQQSKTPVAEDTPRVIEGSGTVIHGERLVL